MTDDADGIADRHATIMHAATDVMLTGLVVNVIKVILWDKYLTAAGPF